jgi:translocator protein
MLSRLIIFIAINFLGLYLGSMFTTGGVNSEWYQTLNKAPWTPPGWVFGAAWTAIMICLAFYMAYAWEKVADRKMLLILFLIQWILNVSWNPIFFQFQYTYSALLIIGILTLVVAYLFFGYFSELKSKTLLVLPYLLWLIIATSLNAYICVKN